jgi:uncharacterized protein
VAELTASDGWLRVRLGRWERLGALRGDIEVPVEAIHSVRAVPNAYKEIRGMRLPGTYWPNRVALGTFRWRGRRDVAAVHGRTPVGVVVDFEPGYGVDRVVVSAAEADAVVDAVRRATAKRPTRRPRSVS